MTRIELEKAGYTFHHYLSTVFAAHVSIKLHGEVIAVSSHASRTLAYDLARERALADFVMRRLAGEVV